jgi:hypothetical protein
MEFLKNIIGFGILAYIVVEIYKVFIKKTALLIEDKQVKKQGGIRNIISPILKSLSERFEVNYINEQGSIIEFVLEQKNKKNIQYFNSKEFIEIKIQLIKDTFFIEYKIFDGYYLNRKSHKHLYSSPRFFFNDGINNIYQVIEDLESRIDSTKIKILEHKLNSLKNSTIKP